MMRIIRCSSLPTWNDCERRYAATKFRWDVERVMGLEFPRRPMGIAAPIGTATHAAVGYSWQGMMRAGDWAPIDLAEDVGIASLRTSLDTEATTFDDTSPTRNDAEHAVRKLLASYRGGVRPDRQPELVEEEMRVGLRDGWELLGHCDLTGRDSGAFFDNGARVLDDLKTGVLQPSPGEQLGAYDLLLDSLQVAPQKVTMTFVKRVRRTVEQPPIVVVPFDRGTIRRQARRALAEIPEAMDQFFETGDPFAFRANTMSRLCSAKFCPAFHTKFCPESFAKPKENGT